MIELKQKNYHIKAFEQVLKYIEDHLTEDLHLTALAEIGNTSKFHFHRLFKSFTRESLSKYIKKRRLTYAAFELVDTDKKIEDIGYEINYNSNEAFFRAFKRQYNKTPARFRKENSVYTDQLTGQIDINKYIKSADQFKQITLPETKLLGFYFKGAFTAKKEYNQDNYADKYWDFMNTLAKHNYSVKDARIYYIHKTTVYKEHPKEKFYCEYETFAGVHFKKNIAGLNLQVLPESRFLEYQFKGTDSEYNQFRRWLYDNALPHLPFDINYEYSLTYQHIGLNQELLDDNGNLDYQAYSKYCNPYIHKNMYYNSSEFISHLFIPFTSKK